MAKKISAYPWLPGQGTHDYDDSYPLQDLKLVQVACGPYGGLRVCLEQRKKDTEQIVI